MSGVLRQAQMRRLVAAWSVSNFADSALFLTLAVWAKDLTGSSGAAGLVFLFLGLPALLAPAFGLLADRVRRRPLLISAHLTAAVVVLGLLGVRSSDELWLLYLVTFCYGGLGVLNGAAQSGLLRSMLDDEHLGSANALLMTIDQGLRVVTPAVGAALYAVLGGPTLAYVTCMLLLIAACGFGVVAVAEPKPERPTDSRWFVELSAGFAHLRRTPLLRSIVVALALALSVIGLFDSVLFAVVEHGLSREPAFFGVLMSAQGAGSILGGVCSAWLLRRLGATRAVVLALAAFAVAGAMFLVPVTAIVLVASALAGAAIPWAFVALATTRQQLTPDRLQGRTAAATNLSLNLPQLISTGLGAALVGAVDYRILIVVSSVVIVIAAFRLWFARGSSMTAAADQPARAA